MEFWHVWVWLTSRTGFYCQRPHISSSYSRGFRLQGNTGNWEVQVDLWGLLGTCIPTWVKFCLFSRGKVAVEIFIVNHGGWAWLVRLQFWKGSFLGYPDMCLSWQRMQKIHFLNHAKVPSPRGMWEKLPAFGRQLFPCLFSVKRARKTNFIYKFEPFWTQKIFQTVLKLLLGGPRDPKKGGGYLRRIA